MSPRSHRTAIVLAAGGVRGAYQAGVIDGIVDVLGVRGQAGPPLFEIYGGSSIGAINATYLAAHAHRADHAIDGLLRFWTGINVEEILRFRPLSMLLGRPRLRMPGDCRAPGQAWHYAGRSLFDLDPVEELIERVIPWEQLHANISKDLVHSLALAVYDIFDGRTTLFTELAPGTTFRPTRHPTRTLHTRIHVDHVLASVSLPLVFPAVRIGERYYMDGGIRFPAPIVPALRAGAERVVVISLLHQPDGPEPEAPIEYPGLAFFLGQILSGLLLDPIQFDLAKLEQTNEVLTTLADKLEPAARREVMGALADRRLLPTEPVPTLVFRPSVDIARFTNAFLDEQLDRVGVSWLCKLILRGTSCPGVDHQALLASLMLLDGSLASELIELGRRDAHAARERIIEFFAKD